MQLGLDPARQTELEKGKKNQTRHCGRYSPAILILFKTEGWSEWVNDWSHRLADWRLPLAHTRSQPRSHPRRITVFWDMASLVLVSVASWCHKICCSCLLIRSTVLYTQIKSCRVEQEEYNEKSKAAVMNFLSSIFLSTVCWLCLLVTLPI